MEHFDQIYAHAVLHRGGDAAVELHLPLPRGDDALRAMADDRLLSLLCLRIFRAGLKHAMVDAKWPAFERAFHGFDPVRCAHLSDDELDAALANRELIRHAGKLKAIRANGQMVLALAQEQGSFGNYLAAWPVTEIVSLWRDLQRRGAQLGGQSAARFLRMAGKDTFLLTDDVVAALRAQGVITKRPSSQRDLAAVQAAFNQWRAQSGRPLCQISRILSFTAD